MKIIDDYLALKNSHLSFFKNLKPKERIKHSNEIIKLKKDCDALEVKIVNGILNYSLDYNRCLGELKKAGYDDFLKDNVAISRFLMNRQITSSIGYNVEERNKVLIDFEELCLKVWEDLIITTDERKQLNDYCSKNLIDKTQQFLIEQKISKKFSDGFDLLKVIKYYYLNENYDAEKIQIIISKEYKKNVDLKRIESLIEQFNKDLDNQLDLENGESKLIKTIVFSENLKIYVIIVNGVLTSGYEFDIGYKEGENDNVKIMISKETYDSCDNSRLIGIITDGLCYYINASTMNLNNFLEMKSNIRSHIEKVF